ncbi:unnamed protein product [Durusdinium trenchii]|uniref:Uncharacterized protein n=2 Tax=Durusdinium trenchii TaxID=1381693 RepID=A0ABP0STB3_9DINO
MFCACCESGDGNTVEEVAALPSLASDTPPTPKAAEKPAVEAPPSSGASFTFRLPDNTSKEVFFTAKPLGLDFSKSIPMIVKAVKKDSVADEAAVQAKWVVTHVKGQEMPTDLRDAMTAILMAVKDLPSKKE